MSTGRRGKGKSWQRGGLGGRGAPSTSSNSPIWRGRGQRGGPAERDMNLIAAPSRSSGLEKDGDTLKDFNVQEEYREFIQGKVDSYLQQYPLGERRARPDSDTRRTEVEQNILILFRKLREGISSSHRTDDFALEVYETSLCLATLFHTPLHATSTLSYLLPHLYHASLSPLLRSSGRLSITLVSLLHHLAAGYPSQTTFHQNLKTIPPGFLLRRGQAYDWIIGIAAALRAGNYVRLASLAETWPDLAPLGSATGKDSSAKTVPARQPDPTLAREAIHTLLITLSLKVRTRTWLVLCTAYRELWCEPQYDTSSWLERTLALSAVKEDGSEATKWLEEMEQKGEVRRKDGSERRWVLVKPKQ